MARRQSGFTLIELMVVMTLAAILLGIGIPSFREFTASQRVKNTAFDFVAAMLLARSEAVKRNASVSVTQGMGGWASGWTVVAGGATLASKDLPANVTITPAPDPATSAVAFQGSGRIAADVRFQFSTDNTTAVRCVTIRSDGVPNTTRTNCP